MSRLGPSPSEPVRSIVTVTFNPTIDRVIEVPGFRVGEHLKGRLRSRLAAGKAINVSRALAALGVPSTAMGWVGEETLDLFEQWAAGVGVTARFTPIAGATRENITIIDPQGGSETHLRDAGPKVREEEIQRLSDALASAADAATLFVFTGSAAPGLSAARFGEMLDLCMDRGARVALDSSGEPLRVAARKRLALLKPNLLELAELANTELPKDADILEAGRRLNESIEVVLVTMGKRGAYCFSEGSVLRGRVDVPRDQVRSTVGCGDALLAGFLAGLHAAEESIEAAFRRSLAVAAASALTGRPGFFDRRLVDRLTEQVSITEASG